MNNELVVGKIEFGRTPKAPAEFYDHLCRNWNIARSPEELEEIDYLHGHK